MRVPAAVAEPGVHKSHQKAAKKFLFYFKKGFNDPKYIAWEREYKWNAHRQFREALSKPQFVQLLKEKKYKHIADIAVRIESRTNLLFSFEKMALRDAIKTIDGAMIFASGLFNYLYGKGTLENRFKEYVEAIRKLPRKQTRVLTWPLVTVFGFIANPKEHIFLKPRVTQAAASKYQYEFNYSSAPDWETYKSLLEFAAQVESEMKPYQPKDFIDLQSFIWVLGSEEYPD